MIQTKVFAAALAALLAALLYGVYRAGETQGLVPGLRWLISEWWGVATLIDVYIGFLFVSLWLWYTERSRATAIFWIVNILWLGNIVTLAVLLLRTLRAQTIREAILPPGPSAAAAG